MLYLTYCSFYSSGNLLPHFSHSLVDAKMGVVRKNVGVLKKSRFVCWPLQPYTCSYTYSNEFLQYSCMAV